METDSDCDQYSDTEEVSDGSMDADDDDYFDTTADNHQRKVRGRQVCVSILLLLAWWVFQGPAHTHILLLLLQTKYVVLTSTDINRRQQEVIDAVTSVLGISSEDAGRILRKYKWWVPKRSRSTSAVNPN